MTVTRPSLATCLALALALALAFALGSAGVGLAQSGQMTGGAGAMDHGAMMNAQMPPQGPGPARMPREPGQSAFATIAEIVAILDADGETDWDRVNIDALRVHLVDMDAVTLRADVLASDVPGGAAFDVTSRDPRVTRAIRAMTIAHAATMSGLDAITIEAGEIPGGAQMVVRGPRAERIRGLGFFGTMALGVHHPAHHIALARGQAMPRG